MQNTTILDIIYKIFTVCIALFNAYFVVKIFRLKNKKDEIENIKDEIEKENDRKNNLFKTLVLDHNLKFFYSLFEEVEKQLEPLGEKNLTTEEERKNIDSQIDGLFIKLESTFYAFFLAIDKELYSSSIKKKIETLRDELTVVVFDKGINLTHKPKYDEVIRKKLSKTQEDIIRELFTFRIESNFTYLLPHHSKKHIYFSKKQMF